MVSSSDTRELIFTIILIGGFSLVGLLLPALSRVPTSTIAPDTAVSSVGVPLVANPVVSISVPAHNVFAQ